MNSYFCFQFIQFIFSSFFFQLVWFERFKGQEKFSVGMRLNEKMRQYLCKQQERYFHVFLFWVVFILKWRNIA